MGDFLFQNEYKSEIASVDFGRDAKRIEEDVNTWVANKTNNQITKLLSGDTVNEDVNLAILNAIYFKGM